MTEERTYMTGNQFAKGNKPNQTAFKKGHAPWNKGLKGIHLSPQSEFKAGRKSDKRLPVGTIRERKCKGGHRRKFIKVANPNKWMLLAEFVWCQGGGTIPKGFVLHHIDRNPLNDDKANLALLNRATHMKVHRDQLDAGKTKPRLAQEVLL